MKKELSLNEAADFLGLQPDSVRRYCKATRIPGAYQDELGAWVIPYQSIKKGIEKKKAGRPRKEKANAEST